MSVALNALSVSSEVETCEVLLSVLVPQPYPAETAVSECESARERRRDTAVSTLRWLHL